MQQTLSLARLTLFAGNTSDPWSVFGAESNAGNQRVMRISEQINHTTLPDEAVNVPAEDDLMKELSELANGVKR